ncbi:unnamed protein product [Peniophora sp. CBMAI 1063]|nr:unnamed protein product [Peniophora sp. CBMAI 1063]
MAADPSYPLYPIVSIIAGVLLLLLILTSLVRQNWNLGVAFLCFWLLIENVTAGANAIIWADNADIKHVVYCDIVSHIELLTFVVKPMATLIITRRVYLITEMQSFEQTGKYLRYKDRLIEWTLGLFIPVLVAGPIYFVFQISRFAVQEGFGCQNATDDSILGTLIFNLCNVIPPMISILVYYPRICLLFYRQNRDVNHFLQSNDSVSRTNYMRIIAIASVDILLTLPVGIATIVLDVQHGIAYYDSMPFFPDWTYNHTDWEPESNSYADLVGAGTSVIAQVYLSKWTSPVLALVLFGLFGLTREARASYWRLTVTIGSRIGLEIPSMHTGGTRSNLGEIEFGERPRDASVGTVIGPGPRLYHEEPDACGRENDSGSITEVECAKTELKSMSDVEGGTVEALGALEVADDQEKASCV